ncbi:LytTR family DNA-binding domain-containing protein [Collimonas sp.]|jgi:DNA-binding LytR/AlgR family response regulator|uniref:LytR/AlgR family response regulator transcription factor n=1 Tax=Collimonas sp. TaxID=1963772 RepID=UPI002C948801|nr:LytTR family DNA-binding domain-containing protein [Collimonas sp.]HWW99320.1 LytTR family DNA-binding domain-containing protein [Collimonas sp.]
MTTPSNLRALIAEDEPILAAALLQALQRLWPELQVIASVDNGQAVVEQTLKQRPDILFLDIKMPGKSGLEAAQELAEEWPENEAFPLIVFVTAYDEYAISAFEHAAADYVLKPISDARLGKTIVRLQERLQQNSDGDAALERLIGQLHNMQARSSAEPLTMIRAAVGNQIRMIPINDVIYFEASDKYINVVTADSESLIRTSLKELLPQIDSRQFWQVHRGTIVNHLCIQMAIRDESGKLSLKLRGRSESLAVSRVFAHLFKQM